MEDSKVPFRWVHEEELISQEQREYLNQMMSGYGMEEYTLIMFNKDKQPVIISQFNDQNTLPFFMQILANMLIELRQIHDFYQANSPKGSC